MMRSLWTAASGMNSQQLTIDVISNNLSNVNTTGYKKERAEFKTLLYNTMQRTNLDDANRGNRPVNLQVGHGVAPQALTRMFTQGNIQNSENKLDVAINGNGFFTVNYGLDGFRYTRDGSLKVQEFNGGIALATAEGYPFVGMDGQPIILPIETTISQINIDELGNISTKDATGNFVDLGVQLRIVQFNNVQGLEGIGSNLYKTTVSTGEPLEEVDNQQGLIRSKIMQGNLESSNVDIAREMVDLIVAQRAYELSSRAITTSDEMLQQANNLKR